MDADDLFFTLKLLAALGCGLMAGFFFAFSVLVMPALNRLQPAQGISAMQTINVVALNPLFFLVFLGTAILCLVLLASLPFRGAQPDRAYLLAGSLLYLVGVFLVTTVFNVPLNDALAKVSPTSAEGASLWARYLIDWTRWNHVRAIAPLLATLCFILALTCRAA